MKSLKKSFYTIFLFSMLVNIFYAQTNPKGTALCDEMFTFLQKNEVHPQVQTLVSSGTNNLPYNIIVNFYPEDIKSEHNLVILFNMDDAYNNKSILIPIIELLKGQNFNSSVVLCYGSKLNIPKDNIIYGSEVFVQALNTNIDNSVLIFNLDAKKNSIISGSNGRHAPSWMLKNLFDAFTEAKITEGLPVFFISQVADFTFSTDRQFLSFLEAEIPCISADIKDTEKIVDVVKNFLPHYDVSRFEQDDSHAFMFKIFGKRIWFSEYRIVNSLIILILLGFLLVFWVGFINRTIRKEFWKEIRSTWYVIPAIYLLSASGFYTGKLLYSLAVPSTSTNYTVFGCLILQICLSMMLVSAFYMLHLSLLKKYTTRSLDFILAIDTLVNQIIFTFFDVSLFPIFWFAFIVSLISLIFRRNWIHIILFVFLIMPFVPYINALFSVSDSEKLHNFLIKNNMLPILISLILQPIYLMWLRILNAVKKRYTKKRVYALIISIMYLFVFGVLMILNRTFYSNKKAPSRDITIIPLEEASDAYDFNFFYDDRTVFSDTIRHIKINSKEKPVFTSLKIISTQSEQPVLYSSNDYISTENGTVVFQVPLFPPQTLEFSYGTTDTIQTLTAEEIFYSEEDDSYYSIVKTMEVRNE